MDDKMHDVIQCWGYTLLKEDFEVSRYVWFLFSRSINGECRKNLIFYSCFA